MERFRLIISRNSYNKIALLVIIIITCSGSNQKSTALKRMQSINICLVSEPDSLVFLKNDVEKETTELLNKIHAKTKSGESLHAALIKDLFTNIRKHYLIDSIYHVILDTAQTDSIKNTYWSRIMKSAGFYSTTFQSNRKIRNIINRGDQANQVPANWLKIAQQFLWDYENAEKAGIYGLDLASNKHPKFTYILQNQLDMLMKETYTFEGFCSKIVSRKLDQFRAKEIPNEASCYLAKKLEKWDIICRKTPDNLTDRFIPGYFGHVGIYIGNGIVAESVQEGVVYSKLQDFSGAKSSYMIIRPVHLQANRMKVMENLLSRQMGKSFDFNFNVESPDKLICTELVYLVYEHIQWHSKKVFGRETIYPDFIVETAMEDSLLEIPCHIDEDGITDTPDEFFIRKLLKGS